jgi:hypothetical protein
MAIQYISNGAVVEADNASVSPGPGVVTVAGDVMLAFGGLNAFSSGRTLSCSGYTTLEERGVSGNMPMSLFGKVCGAGEANPTIVPNGGASGNVLQGVAMLLRGARQDMATIKNNSSHASTINASADNDIVTPALTITENNCLVFLLVNYGIAATNLDDFTPGVGTWTQTIFDATTVGDNNTIAVYQSLQTTATNIPASTLNVLGVSAPGSTARAILIALRAEPTTTLVAFPWLRA